MNKSVYSLLAAAALVGVAAVPAHATGGDRGAASAAVLRAKLDVSLLKGGTAALDTELNAVRAPESAGRTLLKARLDGVHQDKPFTVLSASAATARGTAEKGRAEGYSNLAKAKVHVPGLLRPLAEVEAVTSRAVCEAGAEPVAESKFVGTVKVLGQVVEVKAGGTAEVEAEGVGTVRLRMAETVIDSGTAAATALALDVAVDPGKRGVAEVRGRVTLVEAACEAPGGPGHDNGGATGGNSGGNNGGATGGNGGGNSGGSTGGNGGSTAGDGGATGGNGGSDGSGGADRGVTGGTDKGGATAGDDGNGPRPQTGADQSGEKPGGNLAETGGDSRTPYIAGGALAFLAVGGTLVFLRRRRHSA